jgi:hypothetical protein
MGALAVILIMILIIILLTARKEYFLLKKERKKKFSPYIRDLMLQVSDLNNIYLRANCREDIIKIVRDILL